MKLLKSLARTRRKIEKDIGIGVEKLFKDFLLEEVAEGIFLRHDRETGKARRSGEKGARKNLLHPGSHRSSPTPLSLFFRQQKSHARLSG